MTKTLTRIDTILAAIDQARADGYQYVGVRSTDDPERLESVRWDDGEPTDESLGGLSATDVSGPWEAMHVTRDSRLGYYLGGYIVVVAGDHAATGADDYELVIESPEIIAAVAWMDR